MTGYCFIKQSVVDEADEGTAGGAGMDMYPNLCLIRGHDQKAEFSEYRER